MSETSHTEDEQRHVAELLRSFDARAPESLHRRVQAMATSRPSGLAPRLPGRGSRRLSPRVLAAAGAVAAAIVAVAIAVGRSDSGGAPTINFDQAAASTLQTATLPAPAESRAHPGQLGIAVDGIAFPYWSEHPGWSSTGARTDHISGRAITTVFYADASGQRVGYAILAGTPVPRVGGGVVDWRGGVAYRLLTENGVATVTWLRDGHLCVMSGTGVSSATLMRLASWNRHDETPS